jgi:hypothetical protein
MKNRVVTGYQQARSQTQYHIEIKLPFGLKIRRRVGYDESLEGLA